MKVALNTINQVLYLFYFIFSGECLVEAGESFKQLADYKYSLEDTVKQNFLEPLSHLQSKDIKEVNVRYIHDNRRLLYK